jgi:2-enoate reductase
MKEAVAKGKVVTAVDALLGEKEIGKRMVIIGGGLVGCETGLWAAQQGKSVTVIARHEAMREMWWVNALDIREKLDAAKAKLLTFTNVIEITDDGVVIASDKGKQSTLKADSILLAVRLEPDRALWEALRDRMQEVYAIGDCLESRLVLDAMWEGYRTARLV